MTQLSDLWISDDVQAHVSANGVNVATMRARYQTRPARIKNVNETLRPTGRQWRAYVTTRSTVVWCTVVLKRANSPIPKHIPRVVLVLVSNNQGLAA